MSTYAQSCEKALSGSLKELLQQFPQQEKMLTEYNKVANYTYDALGQTVVGTMNVTITCRPEVKYQGRYAVQFMLRVSAQSTPLIQFTLDLYPECCALHQLNGFYHAHEAYVDEEFFRAFIQKCISVYSTCVSTTNRIILNFVQSNRYAKKIDDPCSDENPSINYPMWYRWAKSFQTTEQRFVNHNTMRIIHNVVVNYRG